VIDADINWFVVPGQFWAGLWCMWKGHIPLCVEPWVFWYGKRRNIYVCTRCRRKGFTDVEEF